MMMGEPIVRNDMYMNQRRIREVATPSLSPMAEQTPKAFHSIKSFISYRRRCMMVNIVKNFEL